MLKHGQLSAEIITPTFTQIDVSFINILVAQAVIYGKKQIQLLWFIPAAQPHVRFTFRCHSYWTAARVLSHLLYLTPGDSQEPVIQK